MATSSDELANQKQCGFDSELAWQIANKPIWRSSLYLSQFITCYLLIKYKWTFEAFEIIFALHSVKFYSVLEDINIDLIKVWSGSEIIWKNFRCPLVMGFD